MNKNNIIITVMALVLCFTMCLVGCNNSVSPEKTEAPKAEKSGIDISDIDWNVDEGVIDGERYVLLNYINNTQYTITSFKLKFKERSGITEEEKTNFYTDIQKKLKATDSDMDSLKNKPIAIRAETERIVEPHESVSNVNCYYYDGAFYLKDISHYQLVEPDIATIKYIDSDKIITVYYDYGSKKYSSDPKAETAYVWSQTDLGTKIPKPDVKVVESGRDDERIYMFDAYGLTLEQFDAYVERCKEQGYTVSPSSFEGFYSADNSDGYNVYLHYDDKKYSMSGTVKAPEE